MLQTVMMTPYSGHFTRRPAYVTIPDIQVTWRPPHHLRFLHYQDLYRGIYEYLRAQPSRTYQSRAIKYLHDLQACFHSGNVLQGHRILWVQAWLDALGEPDSDEDTVVGEE